MAHLLGDSSSESDCSSPVDEQMHIDLRFPDAALDMNIDMSDWSELLDQYPPLEAPSQSSGQAVEEVSLLQPEFINPSATVHVPETPALEFTGLTGHSAAPRPFKPLIAARYPLNYLTMTWAPPAPPVPASTQYRQILIPVTRHPYLSQQPRYDACISQAQHGWNLLQSALGVIPCARRLPSSMNPSFLWRKIPARGRRAANAVSQEVDALYPDEDSDPESDPDSDSFSDSELRPRPDPRTERRANPQT